MPLETIRASLPEDALLMEYYRVGDRFYVCVLSRKSLKIVPLGPVRETAARAPAAALSALEVPAGPGICRTFQDQLLDATAPICTNSTAS